MGSRLAKAALALAIALTAVCAFAGFAQANSPAWKLLAVTGPTNLPPKQSEIQRVTVEATGGTFTLSQKSAEGEGTLTSAAGYGEIEEGSNVASVFFAYEPNFAVGQPVSASGIPAGTTITAVSGPASEPTLELSAPATETSSFALITSVSKEVTGVTVSSGEFQVGDGISGENIPAGTTITAVGAETLTLSEYPTGGGTVALTGTESTPPLPYDASSAEVQSALEALPVFGPESVRVSGGPGGDAEHPYAIEFSGSFAEQNVEQLQADGSELSGEHPAIRVSTTVPGGPGTGEISVDPANIGGASTSGIYTVEVGPLPTGIVTSGPAHGENWSCAGGAGQATITCTAGASVPELNPAANILIPVEVEPNVASSGSATVKISGGGAAPDTIQMPVVVSREQAEAGAQAFWAGAFDADGNMEVQAGGHPYSAISYFMLNTIRSRSGKIAPVGDPKDVIVDLPPGFAGNPLVTPRCPQEQLVPVGYEGSPVCNSEMTVGNFEPSLSIFGNSSIDFATPIVNDVPAQGYAAEFTTKIAFPLQSLLASVRSSDDYGIRITAPNNPNYNKIYGAFAALEGYPAAAGGKPFMRNGTECNGQSPVVHTKSRTWQEQDRFSVAADQVLPPITGCDKLEFHPDFSFQPTNTTGSSGTGATAHLHIPQEGFSDGSVLGTPDLKKTVVKLPEGLVLNPASANGLGSCSEDQIGYIGSGFPMPNPMRFDESEPQCPDASKLGTMEIETPLLEKTLEGTIYLADQDKNPFHSLIALYLVVNDARTGITLKLPGKVEPNPATGQLTATFDNNPQLPFEDLTLHFRGGGPRSELATPEVCGHHNTRGELTPWSAPASGPAAQTDDGFDVSTGCSPSANTRPFAPSFEAGSVTPLAGAYSPLVIKLGRQDGEQEISNLNFTLPEGLTGKLAGVPYCPDGAIALAAGKSGKDEQAAPSCPAASALGSVDTSAGVGSEPIHVGGNVYLAGPYKGAPISAVVITPAVAGPFDLGNVVVRAPLFVNPETAQIEARSDAIPTILQGLPLKVRSIVLKIDRPGFSLNPTSCDAMPVLASVGSSDGATATPSNRFQVGGCNKLGFKPRLSLRLKGGTRRAKNPKLIATLKQPAGQVNIGRVSVALPHSEFLDNSHIRTVCTRVQFAAEQCPKGSIYGHAEAISPLLAEPLKGPVYLRSSNHKLPDLVVALRGPAYQPVEIDLAGRIDSVRGGIRNSFELVPDAPVSKFVLRMQGGKKGLLVNSTNICRGTHRATVKMIGQNNKRADLRPELKAQCKKHRKGSRHHGKR